MRGFIKSSAAIRSHARLAARHSRDPLAQVRGSRGRPSALTFLRQDNLNRSRCRRIRVSGFATVSRDAVRLTRDNATGVMRVASS